MIVITTYFNPFNDLLIQNAYWKFRLNLNPKIHLITAEAVYDKRHIPDSIVFAAGEGNIAWQKESMINEIVSTTGHDSYAWVDADSMFCNPKWYECAVKALQYAPVVQLFEYHASLDKNGTIGPRVPGYAFLHRLGGQGSCKPGGAWAARREVFPLYEKAPLGGGDKLAASAFTGDYTDAFILSMNLDWRRHYLSQAKEYEVTNIPGDLLHFYHGDIGKQYGTRMDLLADFDPVRDITSHSGLLKWKSQKLQQTATDYFKGRLNG